MKNGEINFNFHKLQLKESKSKDKGFLCRKHFMTKDFDFDEFEDGLNISGIDNNEENHKITKNSKNNYNKFSINEDFSQELVLDNSQNLDNYNENDLQLIERKLSFESIQFDFTKNNTNCNNNKTNNYKKKIRKEDLNNIPLPIFDCIYCTNEKIVFNNFINKILSDKYLLLTSNYDINNINKLLLNQPFIDKKLLNIIHSNTEYIKDYIPKEKYTNFIKSNKFNNICEMFNSKNKIYFKRKIELIHKKKDFQSRCKNEISKISNYDKCLFNPINSLNNNCEDLNEFVETLPKTSENFNSKKNCPIGSDSNNSINVSIVSLNKNEYSNHITDNNNILEDSFEKIEKKDESANDIEDIDEIMDCLKYDLKRKISKNYIKWEKKYYDIYNPEISSDYDCEDNYQSEQNYELIKNKNLKSSNFINNSYFILNNSSEFDRYNIKDNNNTISVYNNNLENESTNNKYNRKINNDKTYNNINYTNLIEDINVNRSLSLYNIININSYSNQKLKTSSFQKISSLEINKNKKTYKKTSFIRNNKSINYSKNKKNSLKFITSQQNYSLSNNNSTNYITKNSIYYKSNNSIKPKKYINGQKKKEIPCYFPKKNNKKLKLEKNNKIIKSKKVYNYLNNLYLSYLTKEKSNHYKYNNKYQKNIKYKRPKKKINKNLKFYLFDLKHNKKKINANSKNNNINYKNNTNYFLDKKNFKIKNSYNVKNNNNNNNLYNKPFITNKYNKKKFYNNNHPKFNKAYYFFKNNNRLKIMFNELYLNNNYYNGFYNYNNLVEYNNNKYIFNKNNKS